MRVLAAVWVLERAEGLALEEELVRELSTPARAWLLLWNWLLPWCSRELECLDWSVATSETDPAALPAVPLEQQMLPAGWLLS